MNFGFWLKCLEKAIEFSFVTALLFLLKLQIIKSIILSQYCSTYLKIYKYVPCYVIQAPSQRMTLIYQHLPEALIGHFVEGLHEPCMSSYDFLYHGALYAVRGVVQYVNHPDHFVAWIRDSKSKLVFSIILNLFSFLKLIWIPDIEYLKLLEKKDFSIHCSQTYTKHNCNID